MPHIIDTMDAKLPQVIATVLVRIGTNVGSNVANHARRDAIADTANRRVECVQQAGTDSRPDQANSATVPARLHA